MDAFAWWIWIVIGLGLLGIEVLTTGFLAIWFGLGALIVGFLSLFLPLSLTAQLLLWSLSSLGMTVLWFAILKKKLAPTRSLVGQSSANIIGEIGIATTDIQPFKRGIARFQRPICGSEVWECLSDDDIQTGDRVRIVSVEGNLLKVALQTAKN